MKVRLNTQFFYGCVGATYMFQSLITNVNMPFSICNKFDYIIMFHLQGCLKIIETFLYALFRT